MSGLTQEMIDKGKVLEVFDVLRKLPERTSITEPAYATYLQQLITATLGLPKTSMPKMALLKLIVDPTVVDLLVPLELVEPTDATVLCRLLIQKSISLRFPNLHHSQRFVWKYFSDVPIYLDRAASEETATYEVTISEDVRGACNFSSVRTYSGQLDIPVDILRESAEAIEEWVTQHRYELAENEADMNYSDYEVTDVDNLEWDEHSPDSIYEDFAESEEEEEEEEEDADY